MSERSHVSNGRFLYDLSNWVTHAGAPAFSVGDGDDHYGVAVLAVGDALKQDFTVPETRQVTLHLSVKCASAITAGQVTAVILDDTGAVVKTIQPTANAATWTESETTFGLALGESYELRLTNVSAAASVYVDDVWIYHVPITRAQIAAQVAVQLGRLASERSLVTTSSGTNTEGDYTYAVDAGLRSVGALDDETGLPDVRWLDPEDVDAVIEAARAVMTARLMLDYSSEVDVTIGPRSERLSQKAAALQAILKGGGSGASGGRIQQRKLTHTMGDDYRV